MALKRPRGSAGTLVVLEHTSTVLRGNPLRDPHVRRVAVWLPPQYDAGALPGRGPRFPTLYDFVGFTGSGLAHANWKPFGDKGYKFRDRENSHAGMGKFKLKGHATRARTAIKLSGADELLPIASDTLPVPTGEPVTVRLHNSDNENCWGADFAGSSVLRNDEGLLKAKLP